MAYSSDASYGASSRVVKSKIDLYLDGATAAPLSITRDNYLVTSNILEEATAGDTLFEGASSNELVISLNSPNGIFNPTNPSSPYYGKMKRGIRVIPFFRTNDADDWLPLGEFYVTQWTASLVQQTASITANDIFYGIFDNEELDDRPIPSISIAEFWRKFFDHFGIIPKVDPTLTSIIPFAYVTDDNKMLIKDLCAAYLTICNVSHSGTIHIRDMHTQRELRATLYDSDQILEIDAQLSISSTYDTAHLTYYVPMKSAESILLEDNSAVLKPGENQLSYQWNAFPLYRMKLATLSSKEALVDILKITCTSKTVALQVNNPKPHDVTAHITISGQTLASTQGALGQEGENTLYVDNKYIQTLGHAEMLYSVMQRYTTNTIPILSISLRGNPNLEIGDKIRVLSARYDMDFTGIILRQNFTYDGGLSCTMTVLNSKLVEVVTT